MIVTDKFVFIHLHKTGGQSLNDAITRNIPGHENIGYHYPHSMLPEQFADRPVLGVIRNPWDWYVSWYAFNQKPRMNNPLFHVASGGGSADFRTTISNLANLGDDTPNSAIRRDQLLQILPESLDNNRGSGLIKSDIEDLAKSADGYYSWLCKRMFGQALDKNTYIARFENLQNDFVEILRQLEVLEVDAIEQDLSSREHKNASLHSHYSHYYDDTLCEKIATLDGDIVQQYSYKFEAAKPAGACYDFPADIYTRDPEAFQKLLGRADNFLQLSENIDTAKIRNKIADIADEKWHESEREQLFAVHKDTGSLQLVHFEDHKHEQPINCEFYDDFSSATQPIVDAIANYYRDNGFVVRMILAKLSAGGSIPQHTDAGYSLLNCHRVHLPIITNNDIRFTVGGEEINMQVGEMWEINNGVTHGVVNQSEQDRVHLIVDWMPNPNNAPLTEALIASPAEASNDNTASEQSTQRSLDALIARANEQHKSGQIKRAESLYRQVINFDEQHVVANNLLGLLCCRPAVQRCGWVHRHCTDAFSR